MKIKTLQEKQSEILKHGSVSIVHVHAVKVVDELAISVQITSGLFFKASLGAHPFICKSIFIVHTQIKLIFM